MRLLPVQQYRGRRSIARVRHGFEACLRHETGSVMNGNVPAWRVFRQRRHQSVVLVEVVLIWGRSGVTHVKSQRLHRGALGFLSISVRVERFLIWLRRTTAVSRDPASLLDLSIVVTVVAVVLVGRSATYIQ